jgi:RNA polymerase sigma factor (sigma-70 family)
MCPLRVPRALGAARRPVRIARHRRYVRTTMRRSGRAGPRHGGALSVAEATSFARLYGETYPAILSYFSAHTHDEHAAQELTSETYAKAFAKRRDFRGSAERELLGWLWAIARNELSMYWRHRANELTALGRLGSDRPHADEYELERIEERISIECHRESIERAVGKLSAAQQEVIRMHEIEELSHREIAERLGVSVEVVRARLSRGRRRLASDRTIRPLRSLQK